MSEGEQSAAAWLQVPLCRMLLCIAYAALTQVARASSLGSGRAANHRPSTGPATGPTPGHWQKLAPIPETAQPHQPREAGDQPKESGHRSYHHSYADFEI